MDKETWRIARHLASMWSCDDNLERHIPGLKLCSKPNATAFRLQNVSDRQLGRHDQLDFNLVNESLYRYIIELLTRNAMRSMPPTTTIEDIIIEVLIVAVTGSIESSDGVRHSSLPSLFLLGDEFGTQQVMISFATFELAATAL